MAMKNTYAFLNLLFVIFSSCSLEDEEMFAMQDDFIKNEGYLPLGAGNTWVYDTWSANLDETTGVYKYEGLAQPMQNSIAALEVDETNKQIGFKFAPFVNGVLGALMGNFDKVIKIGNKYYRNAELDPSDLDDGVKFDLTGSYFLNDSATVGEMLYAYSDSIETNTLTPMKIKYGYKTYVTGKYDKLPDHLTRTKGVDDHLAEYTDIIKITDSLTIEKFEFNLNSIELNVNMASSSTGNTIVNQSSQAITKGWLDLLIRIIFIGPIPIPVVALPFPLPQPFPPAPFPEPGRELGFTIGFTSNKKNCPMKSIIAYDDVFNYKFDLISNDTPIVIDSYYARGVGKIKSVTNINQVRTVLGVNDRGDSKNGLVKLSTINTPDEESDPNCVGSAGTATLALNLNAILEGINISIPISGGIKKDLIQNLKYHVKRQ
jgi:hypothetical protein